MFSIEPIVLVEPLYSVENVIANYLLVSFSLSFVGVILAITAANTVGLGKTLDGFFNATTLKERDDTVSQVDALLFQESQKSGKKDLATKSIKGDELKILQTLLKKYAANDTKAYICLFWSAIFFVSSLYALHTCPAWWSVLLMGFNVVRGFMIFHDACHLSFFQKQSHNDKLAWVMSTFIPQNASDWTKSHNFHHKHLGKSETFDASLTVWFNQQEYHEMPLVLRVGFRIVRDPILMPPILSLWVFWLAPLFLNPMETTFNRSCFYLPLLALLGPRTTLLFLLASWVGGVCGIQLFHLQHQCNAAYRVKGAENHSTWDAGMYGSTHLLIPWPLSFVTLGIEFHHIHHASTRVPSYNLASCHAEGEETDLWNKAGVNRIGGLRAIKSCFHVLFEDNKWEVEGKPSPRFVAFDIYQALGLHD